MIRLITLVSFLALVFGSGTAFAQAGISIGAGQIPSCTHAALQANTCGTRIPGYLASITDGDGSGDPCASGAGTGSTLATCRWSGSVWALFGTPGAGGGITGIAGSSGGTTTGTTVTLAQGTGITTVRSGDTVTITATGSGGDVATDAIWDANGDLAQGSGANTAARLAIGAANSVLTSNGTTFSWDATPALAGTDFTGTAASLTAGVGSVVPFADAAGDTTTFVALGTAATGNLAPATDAGLTYNATTNVLSASGGFSGAVAATDLTGTIAAARVGADHIDAITEIAAGLKTGQDGQLVTGTLATTDRLLKIDANDDAVESACSETSGDFDCPGDLTAASFTADRVSGVAGTIVLDQDPDEDAVPGTSDGSVTLGLTTGAIDTDYDCRIGVGGAVDSACPYVTSIYSVAGASISGSNVDNYTTPLNIASELGSAVGSHVVVDVANDHIELLTAGTYKITFKILAGFVIATTECMAFEVYNKTGATTIPMQQNSFQGTGDHATTDTRRGTSVDGVAWITIATPTDVEIYAKGCTGGTFPTTNTIGSASSSIWVERVK